MCSFLYGSKPSGAPSFETKLRTADTRIEPVCRGSYSSNSAEYRSKSSAVTCHCTPSSTIDA